MAAPRLFHLSYAAASDELFGLQVHGAMASEGESECRVAIYAVTEPPDTADVPRPSLDAPAPALGDDAPIFESVLPPAVDGVVTWRAFDIEPDEDIAAIGADQPLTIVVAPCEDALVQLHLGVVTACSERRDDSLSVVVEG